MFEIILWEVSLKNKRGRLFFKRLFVPQASQSSHDRRAEPDVLLAVSPARSACGMGGYDERTAFSIIWRTLWGNRRCEGLFCAGQSESDRRTYRL